MQTPSLNNNVITLEKLTAIDNALTALENECDFLIALTTEEKRQHRGLGQKTEAFAYRALEAGKLNGELLPRNLDLDQIEAAKNNRAALLSRLSRIQRFAERLEDTVHLEGAQMLKGSLTIYKSLKTFGRAEGLDTLIHELGLRFKRPASKEATPEEVAVG